MDISVEFDTSAFDAMLDNLQSGLSDATTGPMHDTLSDLADIYSTASLNRYDEASAGNGIWPDLAPSTKRARAAMGAYRHRGTGRKGTAGEAYDWGSIAFPILVVTGRLNRSILEGQPGHFERYSQDGIVFGSDVPYGAFHQFGTSRMPRRAVFVPLNDPTLDQDTIPKMQFALTNGFKNAAKLAGATVD